MCRVRYFGTRARIEVAPEEIARLRDETVFEAVCARFLTAGFEEIEVDPDGYRQGSLNGETFALLEQPASGQD